MGLRFSCIPSQNGPPWADRSTPWSPQPAPRVVVTRRSVSPVRTGHAPRREHGSRYMSRLIFQAKDVHFSCDSSKVRVYPASPSPQYPASPAVSPQAMYRTILPEANPWLAGGKTSPPTREVRLFPAQRLAPASRPALASPEGSKQSCLRWRPGLGLSFRGSLGPGA